MGRTYDYPAKNAVRERWMRFLPASFTSHMQVHGLYLPGAENLELSGYLAKGLNPANLIGLEREDQTFRKLRRRAGGIVAQKATTEEAIKKICLTGGPLLTFASLDFESSYHHFAANTILPLFQILPAQEAGYLSVTSYAARDSELSELALTNLTRFQSALGNPDGFYTNLGRILDRFTDQKKQVDSEATDHAHMCRELGFLWWVALGLGFTDRDGNGQTPGKLNDSGLNAIWPLVVKIAESVAHLDNNDLMLAKTNPALSEALANYQAQLWPTDFQRLLYYSQNGQPMQTWFIRVCRLAEEEQRPTVRGLVRQIWELAARAPLQYINNAGKLITFE